MMEKKNDSTLTIRINAEDKSIISKLIEIYTARDNVNYNKSTLIKKLIRDASEKN